MLHHDVKGKRITTTRRAPQHARPVEHHDLGGVDGNSRLTGSLAAILLVLLALEGVTILRVGSLLTPHVFIGVLLIPPVLVKVATTSWRFVKYYTGDPDYRRKGPPTTILRLLGPLVVVLTLVVLASGVALVLLPGSMRSQLLVIHQASFVLWFAVMAIHVLGHLVETAKLAPLDWFRRTRRQVNGASVRQWVLASSLTAGLIAAVVILPYASGWWSQTY
jgi:hypothetical protein